MPLRPREINDTLSKDAIETLIRQSVKREVRRLNSTIDVLDHGGLLGLGDDDHNDATNGYMLREPAAGVTDNAIPRWDGTGGRNLQDSGWIIDDSDVLTAPPGGDIDLGTNQLFLDDDLDTYIVSVIDDNVTFVVGGSLRATWTNTVLLLAVPLDMDGNEIILDTDGDTSIHASTDDQIDFRVGGTDRLVMSASALTGTGLVFDSNGSIIQSGGGLIDSEGGGINSGAGIIDSEGGIIQSGGGLIDTEGGDLDMGGGLLLNMGGKHVLVKAADETITNDNTLSDDDTLVTPTLEINTTYTIRGMLMWDAADAVPDYKYTFTFPTSTTNIAIASVAFQGVGNTNARDFDMITSDGDVVIVGHAGVGFEFCMFEGTFTTAGTAGTCDMQWAARQNVVSSLTFKAGSYMEVERVG